ncbi:DUF3427 domain-containing protein [Clostridium perfringens]|nr:DEAD/DEAH box helicase [Clostridium perfringens]MDU4761916.1 DEAD/DEAH box helicase [Clostridium perfringens]
MKLKTIENNKTNYIPVKTIINTDSSIKEEIIKASNTGLIDKHLNSNLALSPKLIINDYSKGSKVLNELIVELNKCDEFFMSVAFITSSGITPLLETFKLLNKKGIPGRILTTNYLNFSEPNALKKLLQFDNITLKMYTKENFHTKGYMFKHKDHYKLIVGSSNLTQTALTKNKEWNIQISSLENGALTKNVIDEFNNLWTQSEELNLNLINTYEDIYKKQRQVTKKTKAPTLEQYKLTPNKMQTAAIDNLNKLRKSGATKALLISSTGTGKTYLSAFELRNFNPKKALFVVHREQLAKQALNSFKNVFGDTKTMGILSGNIKEFDKDILFSTVQTLSKDDTLSSFKKDDFDYIIIDEVHRAGAASYQKFIDYFTPKFLFGMTATPERNDDFDIFKAFDHNIAYEIRLQQALEEDLLCPFHYFGISDIIVDGKELNDKTDFNLLTSEDRVKHIIEKINFYGYSGNRVKGLIFCSNQKEAFKLSELFNIHGFNTVALTGDNSQNEREDAINRLEQDEKENSLDYIFTVDIFNEGVDIPSVNQVIMLRPTKSSIVFIQQLGRGLRKCDSKEYVVILDFIGNYTNNFLIPIALSGDRSFNKDNTRKYITDGTRMIPGCSTINFDDISKKKIFESIDAANFNDIKLIKENYNNLKFMLGRIPKLVDFDEYDSIDPLRIFDNKSLGSYYKFLKKYEKSYEIKLDKNQELFIEFISKKLASGKRIHELLLLKIALDNINETQLISKLKSELKSKYNINFTEISKNNIVNIMTNNFLTGTSKDTYKMCIFLEKSNLDYELSKSFKNYLNDLDFKYIIEELIDFGISRYKKFYSNRYMDTNLQLYQKYTYEDVCRLLEWEKSEVPLNIGGYKFDKNTKTYPVFINYDKPDYIADTIKYEDKFISPSQLIAISKSGRTKNSDDIKTIYNADNLGVSLSLFVRKNKDDKISKEFYFLGKINTFGEPIEFEMPNTNKSAVEINYSLHTPVREDIYEYLTS